MTDATLTALRESIAHHERARDDRKGEIVGPQTCALCRMFLFGDRSCEGCPVRERTGQRYCYGSPYYPKDTSRDLGDLRTKATVSDDEWRQLEQAEIDFLKSLLPEGEG